MNEQIYSDNKNPITVILLTILAIFAAISIWKIEKLEDKLDTVLSGASYPVTEKGSKGKGYYLDVAVRNTVRKHFFNIQKAYNTYLEKSPAITDGRIEIDWLIDGNGVVVTPEVIYSDFTDKTFLADVLKAISSWNFPPPPNGRKYYVEHTFNIRREAGESTK